MRWGTASGAEAWPWGGGNETEEQRRRRSVAGRAYEPEQPRELRPGGVGQRNSWGEKVSGGGGSTGTGTAAGGRWRTFLEGTAEEGGAC